MADLTVYRIDRPDAGRLLFLFHGYSAEQHHLACLRASRSTRASASAPSPPGPSTTCPKATAPAGGERGPDGPDPASFLAALDTVEGLIERETAAAGIPRERCVIGGFSQGGALSLALTTRQGAPRYAGLWAMCCALPDVPGLTLDPAPGAGTPALIQHGTADPIISVARATATATVLGDAGWTVRSVGYDMGHSQTIEMMIDARAFLATIP